MKRLFLIVTILGAIVAGYGAFSIQQSEVPPKTHEKYAVVIGLSMATIGYFLSRDNGNYQKKDKGELYRSILFNIGLGCLAVGMGALVLEMPGSRTLIIVGLFCNAMYFFFGLFAQEEKEDDPSVLDDDMITEDKE